MTPDFFSLHSETVYFLLCHDIYLILYILHIHVYIPDVPGFDKSATKATMRAAQRAARKEECDKDCALHNISE